MKIHTSALAVLICLLGVSADAQACVSLCERDLWAYASRDAIVAEISKTDLKTRNVRGETALMFAASYGMVDMAQVLLDAGVDRDARDTRGRTALMFITGYNTEILKTLIKAGIDVNAQDHTGSTELLQAVRKSSNKKELGTELLYVEMLLEAGADANAQNEDGRTALIEAAQNSSISVLKALLDADADVNAQDNQGRTALMEAHKRELAILETLIKAGADVNARDKDGETTLMLVAAVTQDARLLEALMDAGADASAESESVYRGGTAWDYAQRNDAIKGTEIYWRLNDARFKN
jgi:ankyrin repeat protein